MDTRLYVDVNRLTAETPWAHGVATTFASWLGLAVLGLLVLLGLQRTRAGAGGGGTRELGAAIWAALAAAAAFAVGETMAMAIDRPHPYQLLAGAVVLVPRTAGHSLPSAAAAAAGALAAGLLLAAERLLGGLATLVALALAFDGVYVGANYPGDVLAGLGLGIAVVLIGYLPVVAALARLAALAGRSGVGAAVVPVGSPQRRAALAGGLLGADDAPGSRATTAGPAARPHVLAASGAVRVLEDRPMSPRQLPGDPSGGATPAPAPPGEASGVEAGRNGRGAPST